MMFCPKCDAVLIPLRQKDKNAPKGAIGCPDCDYVEENTNTEDFIIREEISEEDKSRIEILEASTGEAAITDEIREELQEAYREAIQNYD